MEHMEEIYLPTDYVSFKAQLGNGGKPVATRGGSIDLLDFQEEEWVLDAGSYVTTKAVKLYNSLDGLEAGVYGYVYTGEWSDGNSPIEVINGHSYTFDNDQLDAASPVRWSVVESNSGAAAGHKFRAFVYAPKGDVTPTYQTPAEGTPSTDGYKAPKGAPVIKIPNVQQYQNDIIVADKEIVFDMSEDRLHRKEIQLGFEHIYTAIQFKAGFACTINNISITGIKTGGDYVLGSGWEPETGTSTFNFTLPDGGLQVTEGDIIGDLILMVPQTIESEDAKISLTYNGSTTVTASLKGVEWKQGKKITYTLMNSKPYIYFDLAAGNVVISGNTYKGYVFVNHEAKEVSGTIAAGQKYYVYQSCVTETNKAEGNYKVGYTSYDEDTKTPGGEFTKPSYEPVKYDGKLWSDYITNNTSVEDVIEAWDDAGGANENKPTKTNLAVRLADREATKNKISITGTIGKCEMIIDNIYCSEQHKGQNRTYGSVTYKPEWRTGSELVLNLHGDNRLGCLHYDNNTESGKGSDNIRKTNTNKLIIDGEGSLTVADADFYIDNNGYYSNHYDSAIGNADNINSTYGIVINGGTIFAGTTAAENSSAIGAGGNGYGDVVINGGVVTAVASTTGTAIGGGIGYSDTGGKGYVEINGGNVYAYNHKHSSSIPSSAIGGAGSNAKEGSEGTVIITGGNVYAQSALGTAIGGGSSKTQTGGFGKVTITGGNVIAKSLNPLSAGIGGGSTCTGSGTLNNPNGGNAIIILGDNNDKTKVPILRTGSIGGGGTNATGGTVGSAEIYVYGGDIQAQFVMAQSDGNIFMMEGGLIRNSSTSSTDYHCIKPDGAAVYMEKGTFTMSGGIIKECSSDKSSDSKGGAVYIKGDENTSFTMSGGEIRECRANSDGGAVYLNGGSVTIEGGIIDANVAYDGNGGAVCVMGGNFTMDGTGSITQNAAFNKTSGNMGNGGGIYVAPLQGSSSNAISVNLVKGSITSNSADRFGGGVCVDMGANTSADLSVIVGAESEGGATSNPLISGNSALIKGGGMYVNGSKASVLLNDGSVLDNGTSSYQVNPDMTVEGGGLVTLKKTGITTQVTVTFSNNAQYYTQGATADVTKEQYIVAAANSKLDANAFEAINDYYDTFIGWNTKRDGTGKSYTNEEAVALNESVVLYAQWE